MTSGPVQRHSGFEWLGKHNRFRPEPIRFVRLDSEHAQSDRKSVNRGLPVLDLARGHDSWCWPKGARPLGTRMPIRFIRVGLGHVESEGKSMNHGLPVLDNPEVQPRALDSLETRMCRFEQTFYICISELQTFNLDAVIVREWKFFMLNRSQSLAMRIQCTHQFRPSVKKLVLGGQVTSNSLFTWWLTVYLQ